MKGIFVVVTAALCGLVFGSGHVRAAAGDLGPYAQDFFAFCLVVDVARRTAPESNELKDWSEEIFNEIMRFNMSISDDKWQDLFVKDNPGKLEKNAAKTYMGLNPDVEDDKFDKNWERWHNAKKTMAQKDVKVEGEKNVKWQDFHALTHKHGEREAKQHIINQLAERALEIHNNLQTNSKTTRETEFETNVQNKFREAICGEEAKPFQTTANNLCGFGALTKASTGGIDLGVKCHNTDQDRFNSMVYSMMCICSEVADNGAVKGCVELDETPAMKKETAKLPKAAIDMLLDKCPHNSDHKYSNADMSAALSSVYDGVQGAYQGDDAKKRVVIGQVGTETAEANKECGNNSNGLQCADYSKYFNVGTNPEKKGFSKVPWVEKIMQAQETYNQILKKEAQAHLLQAEMMQLMRRVEREYKRIYPEVKTIVKEVPITTVPPTTTTTPAPSQAQSQTENPKKNHDDHKKVCDETKDDEAKCKEQKDHCKYTDDKKCVPISEEPKATEETRKPGTAKSLCPILPIVAVLL